MNDDDNTGGRGAYRAHPAASGGRFWRWVFADGIRLGRPHQQDAENCYRAKDTKSGAHAVASLIGDDSARERHSRTEPEKITHLPFPPLRSAPQRGDARVGIAQRLGPGVVFGSLTKQPGTDGEGDEGRKRADADDDE